jgi:hypothetical protein
MSSHGQCLGSETGGDILEDRIELLNFFYGLWILTSFSAKTLFLTDLDSDSDSLNEIESESPSHCYILPFVR